MSNVIGPIPRDEWNTLKLLKDSIAWLTNHKKDAPTKSALEREQIEYKQLLGRFTQ